MTRAEELEFSQAVEGSKTVSRSAPTAEVVHGAVKTSQIVIGVFVGMWLFAVTSGLVWYGAMHLLRATGDIR